MRAVVVAIVLSVVVLALYACSPGAINQQPNIPTAPAASPPPNAPPDTSAPAVTTQAAAEDAIAKQLNQVPNPSAADVQSQLTG